MCLSPCDRINVEKCHLNHSDTFLHVNILNPVLTVQQQARRLEGFGWCIITTFIYVMQPLKRRRSVIYFQYSTLFSRAKGRKGSPVLPWLIASIVGAGRGQLTSESPFPGRGPGQ